MIHAEDFREHRLQLAPAILPAVGARAKDAVAVTALEVSARERISNLDGITLSLSQVLLGIAVAMGSLTLFIWALVKLWLFGR